MGQAIRREVREQIWAKKVEQKSNAEIARALGISPQSVKRILGRGVERIGPSYEKCGRNGREYEEAMRAAAVEMKAAHRGWGAKVIQLELRQQQPQARLPSIRTLQRWFREGGVNQSREHTPQAARDKGRTVHAVWELDAKEQVRLGDGSRASAMMTVDEASGALIAAATFPPRRRTDQRRAVKRVTRRATHDV